MRIINARPGVALTARCAARRPARGVALKLSHFGERLFQVFQCRPTCFSIQCFSALSLTATAIWARCVALHAKVMACAKHARSAKLDNASSAMQHYRDDFSLDDGTFALAICCHFIIFHLFYGVRSTRGAAMSSWRPIF